MHILTQTDNYKKKKNVATNKKSIFLKNGFEVSKSQIRHSLLNSIIWDEMWTLWS